MKKRFIFDENFIKKKSQKFNPKWLIIGLSALTLLVVLIVIILATKNNSKHPIVALPVYEFKKEIILEAGSEVPKAVDYFKKLENVDVNTIKIEYPEAFEASYDTTSCTAKEIDQINDSENYNINDFECVKATLNAINTYGVKVILNNEEHTVNINVVDTTSPLLITKDLELPLNSSYKIEDFISSCTDITSECKINYYSDANYENITDIGEHEIKIIATDDYGNTTDPVVAKLTILEAEGPFKLTFDTDGGSYIEAQTIEGGAKANRPTDPTKDGYKFIGWYYNDNLYTFDIPLTSDVTLIAKWQQNPSTPNNPSNPNTPQTPSQAVTSISLNYQKMYLTINQSKTVKATVRPASAVDKTVTWTSSDNSVATVENGVITGKKIGTATITASAGGKSASVKIEVINNSSLSCPYGDSNYNTSYTLSVSLINNGCAANPNSNNNQVTSVINKDRSNAIRELASMGFSQDYYEYKYDVDSIYNNTGNGIVGWQITVTINAVDPSSSYNAMSAKYVINTNGTRSFINNNIIKGNIKFQ